MKLNSNVAVSDSGFVFNPATGNSYSVNPVGAHIIKLIQEDLTDSEIGKKIAEEYIIDAASVEIDYTTSSNCLKRINFWPQ
jgi:hypothetical protein